jgi:hypothetical protein
MSAGEFVISIDSPPAALVTIQNTDESFVVDATVQPQQVEVAPFMLIGGSSAPAPAPLEFRQETASTVWTFNHTLNRRPIAQVTDLAGNQKLVAVQSTLTQVVVRCAVPSTGIVAVF